jgi:alanine racemase
LPIVGRVCMNHTMVDVTNVKIQVGDSVTIFSTDSAALNMIALVCSKHGLFPYAVLTHFASSIRRQIV